MKYFVRIISLFVCAACLSSCGVLSRARYGNGWKLNIESNPFARSAPKAAKKNQVRKYRDSVTEKRVVDHPQTEPLGHVSSVSDQVPEMIVAAKEKAKLSKGKRLGKLYPAAALKKPVAMGQDVSVSQDYYVPVEPTVRTAAYLFYGGMIASLIPYVSILGYLAMTVGFILAIIGLRNLKLSDYAYRGHGLALSIVILYLLGLILFFLLILVVLALII
jgi:hypothetical protein